MSDTSTTEPPQTEGAALEFTIERNPAPASAEVREAVLADPGFGKHFTDHMVIIDWTVADGWHDPRVVPYGPLQVDPASSVLHYGQEIFEGLKAYRRPDGSIVTFRADANARRLNTSADRLALPGELGAQTDRRLTDAEAQLSRWPFRPNGTEGYAKAEVTVGGISTANLSSQTMMAKSVPGLYAIGEAVDVTGWLGGYNFQWAWASGYAAGQAL